MLRQACSRFLPFVGGDEGGASEGLGECVQVGKDGRQVRVQVRAGAPHDVQQAESAWSADTTVVEGGPPAAGRVRRRAVGAGSAGKAPRYRAAAWAAAR